MIQYSKYLSNYYTPSNINQYKEILDSFEWNLFLSPNTYYPSLDSIHKFLYQLTRNGKEWNDAYNQTYNKMYEKYGQKV